MFIKETEGGYNVLIKFTVNTKVGSIKNISRGTLLQLIECKWGSSEKNNKGTIILVLACAFSVWNDAYWKFKSNHDLWQGPNNNITIHVSTIGLLESLS